MSVTPPSPPPASPPVENGRAMTGADRTGPIGSASPAAEPVEQYIVRGPQGECIVVRRCNEQDLDPVGDWLDVHLQGDYFFKRRHLRSIIVNPTSAAYSVEYAGVLIGFLAIYAGNRLHNLYLSAEWRGKGLGSALIELFKPATVRAKTNMLAADPTGFYQRQGYSVTGQDPKRPWILEMTRNAEKTTMDVRHDAPGATISAPGEQVTVRPADVGVVPAGLATSPPINPPASHAPPSIGKMTASQVTAIATRLRGLSDDELAAVAHGAATMVHWKKRQQAARDRRLEKERRAAAAAAGQHLDPSLTGEARARVAAAKANAAVDALFSPPSVNGN